MTDDMKITYATMSADQMETLHRGIDDAIEQIKPQLGKTYPMHIDGEAIESSEQFDDLALREATGAQCDVKAQSPSRDYVEVAMHAFIG